MDLWKAVIALRDNLKDIKDKIKNLGRKRPITEEETIRAERKWAVNSEINSGILQERHIFYYSNLERNDMNQKRDEYVALYDARASGKSTLAHLIRRQLKDEGFY
ncbi:7315_t:CDS:2 [Rhizophagus irregularis]|nr:7315_t:CDS:2 [Rhizophagus irregularis]